MTDGDDTDARIAELEATVDGLTNQLVDLQERVRELEAELAVEETTDDPKATESNRSVEELFAEADGNGENPSEEDHETIGDDIILG